MHYKQCKTHQFSKSNSKTNCLAKYSWTRMRPEARPMQFTKGHVLSEKVDITLFIDALRTTHQ